MRFLTLVCKRVVGQVAERLIRVQVGGEVRIRAGGRHCPCWAPTVDVDAHHLVDGMRADVSGFRRQGRGEFALDEEIPALNVSAVHVLRERGGDVGGGQIGGGRCGGGRRDLADRDVGEGRRRHAGAQRGLGNARSGDELIGVRRRVVLVDHRREGVALVAHVVRIDGDAVAGADHGLRTEPVGQAEARSEALLAGGGAGVPRDAALAADQNGVGAGS